MIDCVLVFRGDHQEQEERLAAVLGCLEQPIVTLNENKNEFRVSFVIFLVVAVDARRFSPERDKIKAITDLPPQLDVS